METEKERRKTLLLAKILQTGYLGGVLTCSIALVFVYELLGLLAGDPLLTTLTIALALLGLISFIFGIYLPGWLVRKKQEQRRSILFVFWRGNFFYAPPMYGLILGVLGAPWTILLPFFFIPAVALVLTFPSEERLKKTVK